MTPRGASPLPHEPGWRRAWNTAAARLVDSEQPESFGADLLISLQDVCAFSHAVFFGYPPERRPILLHHFFARPERAASLAAYVRGTFLVDPFYDACLKGIAEGVHRMQDLAPDDFYESIGRHPGYISPCVSPEPGILSEEIGFFARTRRGAYIVLSLMRDGMEPPFSEDEMDRFREVAPLVCATMRLQYREKVEAQMKDRGDLSWTLDEGDLNRVIAACANGHVTPREAEVAAMMLRGHSSGSVARELGVSVSTVKIHRRNLYDKFGVSTQAAFFALILSRILEPPK